MKTHAPSAAARRSTPQPLDLAALLGECAALGEHPSEDSERLALAIRVMEALQSDARADAAAGPLHQ